MTKTLTIPRLKPGDIGQGYYYHPGTLKPCCVAGWLHELPAAAEAMRVAIRKHAGLSPHTAIPAWNDAATPAERVRVWNLAAEEVEGEMAQ